MKNTLFVAGCSFSDTYGTATTCWGEQLAKKLDMKYNHDAVETSGSNDRIFRILTDKIMHGEIKPQDKLMIQYTLNGRREFTSWKNPQTSYKAKFETDEEDLYLSLIHI